MKNLIISFPLLLLFCAPSLRAQEISTRTYQLKDGLSLTYSKPGFFHTMGALPSDLGVFVKQSLKKENLPWLAAITASTLILIEYDQKIYDHAKNFGEKLEISDADKTKASLTVHKMSLIRLPRDLGSFFYFIGDGWINMSLFASFEAYGKIGGDWRALQTGHQLAEGLIATGIATEGLKNVFGRETPTSATAPRGVWRFFPGPKEYMSHRTRYDAFPSGHLATAMMTVTVISENYPEKTYIKPLGYALLTALSFQMVNNGVHWASDYPLGLAVGYGIGKAIAVHGRTAACRTEAKDVPALTFAPYLSPAGGMGASLTYRF